MICPKDQSRRGEEFLLVSNDLCSAARNPPIISIWEFDVKPDWSRFQNAKLDPTVNRFCKPWLIGFAISFAHDDIILDDDTAA